MSEIISVFSGRSRTDTPVDKMMSSGSSQNLRPASAPGEDAPSTGTPERNEVNNNQLYFFNSLDLLYVTHYCTSALFFFLCPYIVFFPSWVLPAVQSIYRPVVIKCLFQVVFFFLSV